MICTRLLLELSIQRLCRPLNRFVLNSKHMTTYVRGFSLPALIYPRPIPNFSFYIIIHTLNLELQSQSSPSKACIPTVNTSLKHLKQLHQILA